jgi:O-antigen/teichoic acid export membrane protein
VPMIWLGTTHYGLNGAAGGWAVGYPLVFLISTWLFTRTLKMPVWQVWLAVGRPLACGVIMVAAVVLLTYEMPHSVPRWITLLAAIGTGAVVYPLAVALLDRSSFMELYGLVRGLLGKGR